MGNIQSSRNSGPIHSPLPASRSAEPLQSSVAGSSVSDPSYWNEEDQVCTDPALASGLAQTSLPLEPETQVCPALEPELNQALTRLMAGKEFKKLSAQTQQTILAFFEQSVSKGQQENARLLLKGVLSEAIKLFPEKTLQEILVANDSPAGLKQRLNVKLEDTLIASSAQLSGCPALRSWLQQSGSQATVLNAAEALILSGQTSGLERAAKLLGEKNFYPGGHQIERLKLQLAMQKSANHLQEVLDTPKRDQYELVLLTDQWKDLEKRLNELEHKPLAQSAQEKDRTRQFRADLQTYSLQTQLYLAKDIQGQAERLSELQKLQASYGQSLELNRSQTQSHLDSLNSQATQLEKSLQGNTRLAGITREFGELELRIGTLQAGIQADYDAYQSAPASGRPALDTRIAAGKQELLGLLAKKEKLAHDIDLKLNQESGIKADYHRLFALRREISQTQGKLAGLERLSTDARSIGDSAALARALDARKQESMQISFSEGMSYTGVRTALGALLTRKADRSALTAEMRLGASVFMVGDVYFLGGMKLEAESDDDGRVVLSFAGYGGIGGKAQVPGVASVKAQGAVGIKTEYVFDNLDDASRFILEAMNKYDPSFIDFVQDVKGPVQGRLPAPNVYTADKYTMIPVLVEGSARLANHEVKATVNYEKLLYQATGKYYESKVDIIAEGGGVGATLTLEWEKHPNGIELKTTPNYGSAFEIKIDLASFAGKAVSTTALTDAICKALEAGANRFSLTPELIRNLRTMVQSSADQAVAEASKQMARVSAPATMRTHTNVKTFSVDGEMSSKLLLRFPITRDLQGELHFHKPQLGLDNRASLSVDGRIPIGGPFSVLAGFDIKAEMRKMLTTDRVRSGR